MTKEKLSLLEFTSKVNDYMHKKACEVGFVFTMEDSFGNECTQDAWKDVTNLSLRNFKSLKEKFRCEAVDKVSEIYQLDSKKGV